MFLGRLKLGLRQLCFLRSEPTLAALSPTPGAPSSSFDTGALVCVGPSWQGAKAVLWAPCLAKFITRSDRTLRGLKSVGCQSKDYTVFALGKVFGGRGDCFHGTAPSRPCKVSSLSIQDSELS